MLDNNQMYVNKTEMADKKFGISEEDQNLTNQLYNEERKLWQIYLVKNYIKKLIPKKRL